MSSSLKRYLLAQSSVYPDVLFELRHQQKESCWTWFIFPQLKGLGKSSKSLKFALTDRDEVNSYWGHPILKKRLIQCCELLLAVGQESFDDCLGDHDTVMKVHACITLFYIVTGDELFLKLIHRFYEGQLHQKTVELLKLT